MRRPLSAQVEAASARVLQLTKTKTATSAAVGGTARLLGLGGHAVGHASSGAGSRDDSPLLKWVGAEGVANETIRAPIVSGLAHGVHVNGVACMANGTTSNNITAVDVTFGGVGPVRKAAPLGPLPPATNEGGVFTFNFTISSAVFAQLEARAKVYPIPWQPAELNATWLVPSRLLAYIFIANPSDSLAVKATLDGRSTTVFKSYNSRGLVRPRCFLGFYLDLDDASVSPNTPHTLVLSLGKLQAGAFKGVFLENVETEYTSRVESCRAVAFAD